MRCPVCGQEYDQPVKFCPNCGVPQPENTQPAADAYSQPTQPEQNIYTQPAQPAQQAYIRQDYTPAPPPQYTSQMPPSGQVNYAPVYAGQPKPSATGQIVFSIINIICCGWGISSILGIIALIFSIMASSATSYEEAVSKLKTAKILNIIGIVLAAIFVIVYIVLFGALIASGDWNGFSDFTYDFSY